MNQSEANGTSAEVCGVLIHPQVSGDTEVLIRTCSLQLYKPPRPPVIHPGVRVDQHISSRSGGGHCDVVLGKTESRWKFEMGDQKVQLGPNYSRRVESDCKSKYNPLKLKSDDIINVNNP